MPHANNLSNGNEPAFNHRRCVLYTFALSRHDNDLHENKPGGQRDSTFYKIKTATGIPL